MALLMLTLSNLLILITVIVGGVIELSSAQGKILTNFSIDSLSKFNIAINLK